MSRTHRNVRTVCPTCGYTCDSASDLDNADDDARPTDGAASICLRCAHVALFAAGAPGGLVEPDPAELTELMADHRVITAITGIQLMNRTGTGVPWSRP